MPQIETGRADIGALKGLHLWHAALSNCSQRVRLALAEKQLAWTSHSVDLMSFEHASAAFQAINPKGLVPVLVHDGRTITDSNDIIQYLDRAFPDSSLSQGSDRDWFDLADRCQTALRTLSHELLFGEVRRLDGETLTRFGRDHGNREFYRFLHRFSTTGFDDVHLAGCAGELAAALAAIEARLDARCFLGGESMSLADLSWTANVRRLDLLGWPLAQWPRLLRWYGSIRARPSFVAAVLSFEQGVPEMTAAANRRRDIILARMDAA